MVAAIVIGVAVGVITGLDGAGVAGGAAIGLLAALLVGWRDFWDTARDSDGEPPVWFAPLIIGAILLLNAMLDPPPWVLPALAGALFAVDALRRRHTGRRRKSTGR